MGSILFIDLDGTLLDSRLRIAEENCDMLGKVIETGATVVFSTGRPLSSAKRLAAQFPKIRYLVSSNGGCVADLLSGSMECVASFHAAETADIVEFAKARNLSPILYSVDRIFADALSSEVYLEIGRSGTRPEVVSDLPRTGIVKALLIGTPSDVTRAHQDFAGSSPAFASLTTYISYPEYLEISPNGAGKVAAGELILNRLGLSWDDAITFGDSANDVGMMTKAAVAVAVANATAEAKRAANIIAPSNDEAGVAIALRWLFFDDPLAKTQLQVESSGPGKYSRNPS